MTNNTMKSVVSECSQFVHLETNNDRALVCAKQREFISLSNYIWLLKQTKNIIEGLENILPHKTDDQNFRLVKAFHNEKLLNDLVKIEAGK